MANLRGIIVSLEVDRMDETLVQDAKHQHTYYWRYHIKHITKAKVAGGSRIQASRVLVTGWKPDCDCRHAVEEENSAMASDMLRKREKSSLLVVKDVRFSTSHLKSGCERHCGLCAQTDQMT